MHGPATALARLLRATSRRLGRSGGTTAPGRLLLRLSPGALKRMAGELDEGSLLVSATNGKTTTSAMLAGLPRARRTAGRAQPGRVQHGLGSRHGSAGRWARARPAGAVRGRRGVAAERGRADRAATAAAVQPVPRPARPLRRARAARRPLGGAGRPARRPRRLRPQRRRPAGGRPRPRAPAGHLLRRRGRLPGPPRHAARRRLEALPQLRPRLRLRSDLPRPHGPVSLPQLRPRAPDPAGGGHQRAARRHDGLAGRAAHAAGAAVGAAPPPRALQRLQRRRGRGHGARAGRAAHGRRRGAGGLQRGVRTRGDDRDRRAPDVRSCSSRTRPAPTRCCAR